MSERMKWCVIGGAAGVANGLFGAGGGLFLVPLFIGWLKLEPKRAFATSIAVIVPLSAVSLAIYLLRGGSLGGSTPLLIGGAIGGLLAVAVFDRIPVVWLRRAFGALILYGGIRSLFGL